MSTIEVILCVYAAVSSLALWYATSQWQERARRCVQLSVLLKETSASRDIFRSWGEQWKKCAESARTQVWQNKKATNDWDIS